MKTEDLTKLPKWAQQRIATLEMRLREAEATITEGPEDSNVFADPYSDTPRPLGRDTNVSFVFNKYEDGAAQSYIKVRHGQTVDGHPCIEIYGSTTAVVYPRSSNLLDVRLA